MNHDLWTERMHAVLDGRATPAEAQALAARLAGDAEAAEEFASWKAMFERMDKLPMAHPPEGLVAAITTRLAAMPVPPHVVAPGKNFLQATNFRRAPPYLLQGKRERRATPTVFGPSFAGRADRNQLRDTGT